MKSGLHINEHWTDNDGSPSGGCTSGNGFAISWQNGPLGRDVDRKEPNGAFVEDIIMAAKARIEFYQASKFSCETNQTALLHLSLALRALESRTVERESRGVEGTHSK